MKEPIKVVGTVIENKNNELLCALHSSKVSLPNMWEFSGRKVEKDENLRGAIERENLLSLKWAPADIPAAMQLSEEKA